MLYWHKRKNYERIMNINMSSERIIIVYRVHEISFCWTVNIYYALYIVYWDEMGDIRWILDVLVHCCLIFVCYIHSNIRVYCAVYDGYYYLQIIIQHSIEYNLYTMPALKDIITAHVQYLLVRYIILD